MSKQYNTIVKIIFSVASYAGGASDLGDMDESLMDDLTKVEKHLLKTQELMKVRGKVRLCVFHLKISWHRYHLYRYCGSTSTRNGIDISLH